LAGAPGQFVHRGQSDKRAGHEVVVVDAGLEVFNQIQLHHRESIACRVLTGIGFDAQGV